MAQTDKPRSKGISKAPTATAEFDSVSRNKKGGKRAKEKKGGGALLWILLGGGAVVCFLFLGCAGVGAVGFYIYYQAGKGVTLANYNKLRPGMTEKEVTDILGSPTRTESAGTGKNYIWQSGENTITVTMQDGKAFMFAAAIDRQLYFGNNNAEASNAKTTPAPNPGGNLFPPPGPGPGPTTGPGPNPGPGPGPGPKPAPDNTPGLCKDLSHETLGRVIAAGKKTEAEIIAIVGTQPKHLGPQKFLYVDKDNKLHFDYLSHDTLYWTDGAGGSMRIFLLNGVFASSDWNGLKPAPAGPGPMPGPRPGPGVPTGPAPAGSITTETMEKLCKLCFNNNPTEAELIAAAGAQPKHLGPQQMVAIKAQSTDTLQWPVWDKGDRGTVYVYFTIYLINGRYASSKLGAP